MPSRTDLTDQANPTVRSFYDGGAQGRITDLARQLAEQLNSTRRTTRPAVADLRTLVMASAFPKSRALSISSDCATSALSERVAVLEDLCPSDRCHIVHSLRHLFLSTPLSPTPKLPHPMAT